MKKIAKRSACIALSVLMLIAVLLGSVSCGVTSESPNKLLEKAVGRTVDQISKWEIISVAEKIANGGSVEFKANTSTGLTLNAVGKMYMNKDKAMLDLNVNDLIKAAVSGSKDEIVVKCDQILGKTYGVSLKNIKENLKKSVFAPDSGTEFALPQDTFDSIIKTFDSALDNKELGDRAEKLKDKYVKRFFEIFEENVTVAKENGETEIFDKTGISATVLNFDVSEKVLCTIIDKFWTEIRDDSEFKALLDDVLQFAQVTINSASAPQNVDDSATPNAASATDDLIKKIDDGVAKIKEQTAKDEHAEENKITAKLFLNKKTGIIMRADLAVISVENDHTETKSVVIELGTELKKFEGIRITTNEDSGIEGDTKTPEFVYIKVDDTDSTYKLTISGTENSIDPVTYDSVKKTADLLTLTYDKNTGKVNIKSDEFEFNAAYTKADGVYTLVLDKNAYLKGEKQEIPADFTLTVREKDDMPATDGGYTEILGLNETEFAELINNIMTNIGSISGSDTDN